MGQTVCQVKVEGEVIEEILSFDYSSDVMALTEEARFSVDNKRAKYLGKLKLGQSVEFVLSNKNVNGGAPVTKHSGIITRRNVSVDPSSGNTLNIVSSTRGWLLENSSAPLYVRLEGKTYAYIVDPTVSPFFHPSWGFKGVRFEGDIRRKLKQGVSVLRASIANPGIEMTNVIQVEPGDTAAAMINAYAKRLNLLVNVSTDNYLCCYQPDDNQPALYSLRLLNNDETNNVLSSNLDEDASTRWTDVIVVGEQLEDIGVNGPTIDNPNASKKRGRVTHEGALPIYHPNTIADGDMYRGSLCQRQAEWTYRRGMFDSWQASYVVSEHFQGDYWYEADTVASVFDDELGLAGNYYVQAVNCTGGKDRGDETRLTIRKPGLLSASYLGIQPLDKNSNVRGKVQAAQ